MAIKKGWQGEVRVAATEAGLVSATSFTVQEAPMTKETALDTKKIINKRLPYAVLEGSSEITGTFVRPFEDLILVSNSGIKASGDIGTPTDIVIGLFPQTFASGNDAIIVKGAKITSWTVTFEPDNIVEEEAEWSGSSVEWKRCEEVGA